MAFLFPVCFYRTPRFFWTPALLSHQVRSYIRFLDLKIPFCKHAPATIRTRRRKTPMAYWIYRGHSDLHHFAPHPFPLSLFLKSQTPNHIRHYHLKQPFQSITFFFIPSILYIPFLAHPPPAEKKRRLNSYFQAVTNKKDSTLRKNMLTFYQASLYFLYKIKSPRIIFVK